MSTHTNEKESTILADPESDVETEVPPQYAVILLNDDYTTMEFVIEVLVRFFHKTTS